MTQKQQHQQTTTTPEAHASEGQEEAKQEKGIERTTAKASGMERPRGLGRELWSNPLSFMQRMMDEMDRMFLEYGRGMEPTGPSELTSRAWSPEIETFEREGNLVLRADLPGLDRKDVKVEVVEDELVISGQRKQEKKESARGRYYTERSYGSFERRMALPEGYNPEDINATFENGVLEVSLKMPEEKSKKRTIEVRGGQSEQSEEGSPRSVH